MDAIGAKRHRITIQVDGTGKDSEGGITHSWTTHVQAWASIEPKASGEGHSSDAVRSLTQYEMRMWYQSGITQAMRVSWDSRLFDIEGIRDWISVNKELILDVVERTG